MLFGQSVSFFLDFSETFFGHSPSSLENHRLLEKDREKRAVGPDRTTTTVTAMTITAETVTTGATQRQARESTDDQDHRQPDSANGHSTSPTDRHTSSSRCHIALREGFLIVWTTVAMRIGRDTRGENDSDEGFEEDGL